MHLVSLVSQKQHFSYAADHAAALARGTFLHRRVQAFLRRDPIADIGRAQAHATDPPVAALQRQRVVAVDGRLRAMKRADAEMYDADANALCFVLRPGNRCRQRLQRCKAEASHVVRRVTPSVAVP